MQTNFLGINYPNENDDPWFDAFVAMMNSLDQRIYALGLCAGPILGGGTVGFTTISVSPFNGNFTWTAPFEVVIPGSGFYLEIPFGPDQATPSINLNDGDRVIVNVPPTSAAPVTAYLGSINGSITYEDANIVGLLTIGIYRGGVFYSNLPRTF